MSKLTAANPLLKRDLIFILKSNRCCCGKEKKVNLHWCDRCLKLIPIDFLDGLSDRHDPDTRRRFFGLCVKHLVDHSPEVFDVNEFKD